MIARIVALLRAVWFLIISAEVGLLYERYRLSPEELETMILDVISRESLLLMAILVFSGLTIIVVWPLGVRIKNIPKKRKEQRDKQRRQEQDKAIRLLNGCASIIRHDWALVRGTYHPAEPYRLTDVLDGLLQRHPTYPDRAGEQRAVHVRLSSYLRQLNATGLLPEAFPNGPCRVWSDDLEHLSAVLQTHSMEAARRSALELHNDSPEAEPHRERKLAITLLETVRDAGNEIPMDKWYRCSQSLPEHVVDAQAKLREMGLGMPHDRLYGHWNGHADELLDLLRFQDGVKRAGALVAKRYPPDSTRT